MTNEKLNEILQKTLAPVEPDMDLNENLKMKMEGKNNMKRFSVKKAVILAAACCLVVGMVSVASSGVAYITSHSRPNEYTSFGQLESVEERAGFSIHAVEQFSNGYQFKEMCVSGTENRSENGNVLTQYSGIDIEYSKDGEDTITLNTDEAKNLSADTSNRVPVAQTQIDGIAVSYYVDTYKWVPAGYELTPEDEANMKRNDYYISDGADEISENQVACAVWVQDGIHYSLMNINNATPADVMFQMAQELIMAE